jgi:hypothetical protein
MEPKLHKYVQRSLFYIANNRFFAYVKATLLRYLFKWADKTQKKTKKFVKDKYFSNLAEI